MGMAMSEMKRNLAVGVTTLAGLAGLLALMMLFGQLPGFGVGGYTVPVELDNAGGLHEGSEVQLNGIPVGQVQSVRFREDQRAVVVEALVREDVRIPTGVQAQASQPLIGGSATLRLRVPPEATDGYISRTDPSVIQGQTEPLSAQLANEVRQTLQRPINRFDSLADELEALSSQWTEVGSNVNRLVSPRRPEKVDGNGDLGPNVSTLVQRIDARMRQLGKTLEDVQSLTGDEQVIDDFRRTLANARKLSGKLDGRIDRISHEITRTSEALRKRYVAVADDLSQAVRSMNRLTDRARQGDGTMGKLLKDPSLYDNLEDATKRIQSAADEMRLLMEKWKSEGVPVQF
jgi:phospholipid/cholesterol/gamma-HCH transport system substrate-binding protein